MIFKTMKCAFVASLVLAAGCNTEAAKKAMEKPSSSDQYTGFGANDSDNSKRKAEMPKPISDGLDPDTAVSKLVDQLQSKQPSFSIAAEEQLGYWATKPGVAPIVVRKVRPMLKATRVEHRAPAMRLTLQFGGREIVGDMIECLADNEPAIRDMAFRYVQAYAPQDYGYDPNAGETARTRSVELYRKWWQAKERQGAVQPPSIYEKNPVTEPRVVPSGQ